MRKVKIKKSDDVCLNCIAFFPTDMRTQNGTPMGQCRRRCPQIVWHFPEKDIATGYPFVEVNGKCMEGRRKDTGDMYLCREIDRIKKDAKK